MKNKVWYVFQVLSWIEPTIVAVIIGNIMKDLVGQAPRLFTIAIKCDDKELQTQLIEKLSEDEISVMSDDEGKTLKCTKGHVKLVVIIE